MAYTRTRTYRNRKRFRRRGGVLSTKNIYSRTSRKAQATQIAALKRKVNKVYRKTKPEKKVIVESIAGQYNMSSESVGNTYFSLGVLDIPSGSHDDQRVGDLIYRKDYWYLTFEYYNNSNTGYHNSESCGTPMRVLAGRWKNHQNAATLVPSPNTLITNYSNTGSDSTMSVIAPLINGVSEQLYIDYDKTFTITSERSQKVLKISTPWYKCRYDKDGYCNHSWLICKAGGLHYDSDFTEHVLVCALRKTVYVDAS